MSKQTPEDWHNLSEEERCGTVITKTSGAIAVEASTQMVATNMPMDEKHPHYTEWRAHVDQQTTLFD